MGTDDIFKNSKRNKLQDLKRGQPKKDLRKNVVIICEGRCTEINYLTSLLDRLKLVGIKPKHAKTSSLCDILVLAQEKIKKADRIFCLFDKDVIKDLGKVKNEIKNNIQEKERSKIIPIISNPCFEYWILLHFKFTRKNYDCSSSPCKQLIEKCLKKYILDYEKKDNFENIVDKYKTAYKNAKKIQDKEGSYTDMPILIDFLENLKKNNK